MSNGHPNDGVDTLPQTWVPPNEKLERRESSDQSKEFERRPSVGERQRTFPSEAPKVEDSSNSIIQAIKEPFDKLTHWLIQDKKKKFYLFNEGSFKDKNILGNKGANLCEMSRLGLPVPPGFIISTEVCSELPRKCAELPSILVKSINKRVKEIERMTGKILGTQKQEIFTGTLSMPLLLSVRSGSPVSMPGMMDTVLYLGCNDSTVDVLWRITGNERFALDTYRRSISSYGNVIFGVDKTKYDEIIDAIKTDKGYMRDSELEASDLKEVIIAFKKMTPLIPQNAHQQLHDAILAIFKSWWNPRVCTYRELNSISDNLGTAVTVQAMTFGNYNDRSATGVCFSRNTSNGEKRPFGEFLTNSCGDEIGQGSGKNKPNPGTLDDFKREFPIQYGQLLEISSKLERHYKSVQDIEFTVENENLWILQTRNAKRTPQAACKFAVDFFNESLLTQREALLSVCATKDFGSMKRMILDPKSTAVPIRDSLIGVGLGGLGGAVVGRVAFTLDHLKELKKLNKNDSTILVRTETSCSDISSFQLADGIITTSGGLSSHASCIMRNMAKTAVIGVKNLTIDGNSSSLSCKGSYGSKPITIKFGDLVTIDGTTGSVYLGALSLVQAEKSQESETLLSWADTYKRLLVFSNSDTIEETRWAADNGAEGVGLVRSEQMFFQKDRLGLFQAMVLSDSAEERQRLLEEIFAFQKSDFTEMFSLMQNKSVCIRLLDPPLHEFLPSKASKNFASELQSIADKLKIDVAKCFLRWEALQEKNESLGLRGARISMLYPEITEMQTKAIISSAIETQASGFSIFPALMIPMVSTEREVVVIQQIIHKAAKEMMTGLSPSDCVHYSVGVMLETPRSLMRCEAICKTGISFVSFGLDDLTSLTFGFSRDDCDALIKSYIDQHVFLRSPFEHIDTKGVGALMKIACATIKKTNSSIKIGVCGLQGMI